MPHFLKDDANSSAATAVANPMTADQADEIIQLLKELVELAKPGAEVSKLMLAEKDAPPDEPDGL